MACLQARTRRARKRTLLHLHAECHCSWLWADDGRGAGGISDRRCHKPASRPIPLFASPCC